VIASCPPFTELARAHGGVLMEEDVCLLQIDFMRAHFTGYLPSTEGNEEFCEDIPETGESIFVIDYLHDYLRQMEVDFRIIRDEQDLGIYAQWEDVSIIENLQEVTTFYQAPVIRADGVLTATHEFSETGNFIGIITAKDPQKDKTYHAVFPFTVGGSGLGYIPLIILLALFVQSWYWWQKRKGVNKGAKKEVKEGVNEGVNEGLKESQDSTNNMSA